MRFENKVDCLLANPFGILIWKKKTIQRKGFKLA